MSIQFTLSRPASTVGNNNVINRFLEKSLQTESNAKLQQVIDYLTTTLNDPIYPAHNNELLAILQELSKRAPHLPDGSALTQLTFLKIKFYSFRFLSSVGALLQQQIDAGDDKAKVHLLTIIKILLNHALISKSDTANLALVELEQISLSHNTTMKALYENQKPKFLRLIIKAILHKLATTSNQQMDDSADSTINLNGSTNGSTLSWSGKSNYVITYMTRALEVFNVTTITNDDISQSLIILTNLIHKEEYNDTIRTFLNYLAAFQTIDLSTLIRNHIQAIVISLLMKRKLSHFDITASLNKLCSFCDRTPNELLATKLTIIKGRLILNYSTDPKSVTDAVYYLSKFEKADYEQPFEDEFEEEKHFIDYLNPSMIGILLGIDSHFITYQKYLGSQESLDHIAGLKKILSILNKKQIKTIHVKLLSTLCSLLRLRPQRDNKLLNESLVELWKVFVSKLDQELRISLLINICVALYDLIDDCSEAVAGIYYELLCKQDPRTISGTLKCLFFIPNTPAMNKVYTFLNSYVSRESSFEDLVGLQKSLNSVLPLLKLENQKCRMIALTKIKQLLKTNQDLILNNMLISTDEPLNDFISKIIENMLALSSTQDASSTALIAECLGILGAINPIRLDHLIYGELAGVKASTLDLTDAIFIANLIERLKNSLFSDQRSESETANYALQVVVKNYSIHKDLEGLLSNEALKACEICRGTNYEGIRKCQPDLVTPVYEKFKSEGQYSYKEWLDKFSINLISLIRDKKLQDILYACSYIFRYNLQLAEYLLPHAILHIIIHQPTQLSVIEKEFTAVVEEDIRVSTQDLDTVYNENEKGNIQTLHFQCANMIFCVMDVVHRLLCDASGKKSQVNLLPKQFTSVKQFSNFLPKYKLALMASKCRAFTRALCYFEQYLFENISRLDEYATCLQRIYIALDDTFEAAGIEIARRSPTTLIDDIANYEASGRFDRAFTSCSISLESADNQKKESYIGDMLRYLSCQGDYHRLYEMSRQLIGDYPKCKRSILPFAVESTWKLGRWDELENMVKTEQLDPLLESSSVYQGFLLASINDQESTIHDEVRNIRYRLMRPLSIALMDRSAYFRGYQNLLSLHSVGDFSLLLDIFDRAHLDVSAHDENTIQEFIRPISGKLDQLFESWNKRNKLVQPSIRSLEPLLVWQRSISQILSRKFPFLKEKIEIDIGNRWLTSAELAREARSFERSFFCLTQTQRWFGSEFDKLSLDLKVKFHIEQAKLAWEQGEQTKAIRDLKLSIERLKHHDLYKHLKTRHTKQNQKTVDPFPDLNGISSCGDCRKVDVSELKSFAQLKMLLTHYSEEAAAGIPETLFFMYEECVHLGVNQEETYFRLARYYDKLLVYYMENPNLCVDQQNTEDRGLFDTQIFSQNLMSGDKEEVYTKLMEHSIIAFGNSLKYGVKYVRESMPRLLYIWYDLGSKKCKPKALANPLQNHLHIQSLNNSTHSLRSTSSRIENTIRFMEDLKSKCLPPYYFMTAISILLSRVSHPHSGVSKKTCDILEMLLVNYPYQMSWHLIALINDTENEERKKAAKHILVSSKKKSPQIERVILDTLEFSKVMNDLCYKFSPLDKVNANRKKKLNGVVKMVEISEKANKFDFNKSKILVPNQSSIRAIIPMGDSNVDNLLKSHIAFPEQNVSFIERFDQNVRIFNSLQRPKQVGVRCTNGKLVNLLCKAGDDLRKDSRCVEFLDLLNRILKRDNQSSARFFEIQTFLVLPIESYAGIIEMVPNCDSLKNIIEPLYAEKRTNFTMAAEMPKRDKHHGPNDLHSHFMNSLLPKVSPPVFPTWFLRKFTEPTAWYMARLAFTRTTAVISMGGYIIGLGDRHLDNILIDTCNGRIVHVDFNLLFHQGETLPQPEIVPFRLTHNIVSSFGSLGTEGNFRKVCEIVMRVMRKEKDSLLTTLKPFMHDPCSEWVKPRNHGNRIDLEEKNGENRSAKYRIEVVERKLKGFPRSKKFKPLTLIDSYSVEAQVDNLIEEAVDTFNLAQMYYGWCPHI